MQTASGRGRVWPWVLGAGIVAAVVLIANLALISWVQRTGEASQLLRAIKVSEQVMTDATDRMGAAIEAAGSNPSQAEAAKLSGELKQISATQAEALRIAGSTLMTLRIAPWDRGIWNAREAYVAHNSAWQAFLDGGARDPQTLFAEHPDITSTWNQVVATLPAAVPSPDPYDLAGQVNAIITAGSADDSGDSGSAGAGSQGQAVAASLLTSGGIHVGR